jgi:hypothetical protein
MTTNQLRAKIAEAVSLDRKIAELTACLKEVKAELTMEAEASEEEHTKTENGGATWRAEGADGCAVVVTFPAAKLASALDPESKKGAAVLELVGREKENLFTPRLDYVLVEDFRSKIETRLDKAVAKKVLKLMTSASAPRVSFETKVETEVAS